MSDSDVKFSKSLNTMVKKLTSSRNGIQSHLEEVGRLAVEFNNIEGYVKKTIDTLDEYGQHTYAKAAILWIEKFYGYTCDEEGKQVEWKGAEFVRTNFQSARDTKFWTMVPEKKSSFKKFDLHDAINAVLAEANKNLQKVADGKVAAELVVVDIEEMRAVRNALKARAA